MPSTTELVRKLYDVATCCVPHVFNGQCPDSMEGSDVRDPDCPACQVLIQVGRQLEGAKPHQAVEVAVKVKKAPKHEAHQFEPFWSIIGNALESRKCGRGMEQHPTYKVANYVVDLCGELVKKLHELGNRGATLEALIKLESSCTGTDYQHKLAMRTYRLAQQGA